MFYIMQYQKKIFCIEYNIIERLNFKLQIYQIKYYLVSKLTVIYFNKLIY